MIRLPVTGWAITALDTPEYVERTVRVLRWCYKIIEWRELILFSALEPKGVDFPLTVRQIPFIHDTPYGPEFQTWQARVLPALLKDCAYTMAIHEDGFPIEPDLWSPEFLEYDWIGPVWHDGVMGGTGMSIRSHSMLKALKSLPWYDGKTNDDEWACRIYRDYLESLGMRFAPPEVASRYVTETQDGNQPSFAFHGKTHCPDKYKLGWQKIEEFEKGLK